MESREHAERLIEYFERIAHENQNVEVWQKGLTTAQEWLRLIDTENASPEEMFAFIGVIHANRYRTSGWHDLALGAYHWVSAKGLSVLPPKEFFAPDGLPSDARLFEAPSLEHAQALNKIFQQYAEEDPSSEAWANGTQVTQEWIKLIEKESISKNEVSELIDKAYANQRKYLSKVWFDTILTMSLWSKAIGYLHLVPNDFQDIAANSASPKVK
jgi:hypothetical protein